MPKDDDTFYEVQLDNRQLVFVFLGALAVCLLFFVLGFWVGRSDGRSEAQSLAGQADVAPLLSEETEGQAPFEEVNESSLPFGDSEISESTEGKDSARSESKQADSSGEEASRSDRRRRRNEPSVEDDASTLGQTAEESAETPAPPIVEPPPKDEKDDKSGPNLVNVNKGMEGQWAVQVAAFADIMQAMAMKRRLEKDGFTAYMEPLRGKDNKVLKYRVRIGKYATSDEAKSAQASLKDKNYGDTWLIDTAEKE